MTNDTEWIERAYPHVDDGGNRYSVDYGGQRWYAEEPIYHPATRDTYAGPGEGEWYQCPLCEEEVTMTPTHDDGARGAIPDMAVCMGCGVYRWSE